MTPARLAVIGIWHLGLVNSVCLAGLGLRVVGVDSDEDRVGRLNSGQPPISEPGVETLLSRCLAEKSLRYTTDLHGAVADATHVLIAFDTPVDEDDGVDVAPIYDAIDAIVPALRQGAIVVVSSQVPVGTCDQLCEKIHARRPELDFGFACVPENLRLGQALERFHHPDMLVIGADVPKTFTAVEQIYQQIEAPRIHVDLRTAEMSKHAINAYLATMISFGNELANLSDLVGADARRVVEALRLEARVSPRAPLNPGFGFAGGTLARDMKVLRGIARKHGYEAPLIEGALRLNEMQNTVALRAIERHYGSYAGLRVGLLGLTYKPGTSTIRRSAAIEMLIALTSAGANVKAYDPMADPSEVAPHAGALERVGSAYDAAEAADALVIATPWPEFRQLDFIRLRASMAHPLLVDAGNFLPAEEMLQAGFIYYGVGRGAATMTAEGRRT
jgi:UDPglucose 6-dehydrogenase